MESLSRLGIDFWSLLLYAVNFGVVVLIVAKYLTKPLMKVLDERKHQIKKNIEEAEELRTVMAKQRDQMEKDKAEMQSKLHEELATARKGIEAKQKEAEAQIEAKKAKMMAEMKAIIQEEKDSLVKNTEAEVLKLIQKIVTYIVSNKVPENVVADSVKSAWKQYKK